MKTSASFQLTPQAGDDLDTIWWFVAKDNRDAAERGRDRDSRNLSTVGKTSSHGHKARRRHDAAGAFLDYYEVPNYVIVYRPETIPLQVVAILHAKRKLKRGDGKACLSNFDVIAHGSPSSLHC